MSEHTSDPNKAVPDGKSDVAASGSELANIASPSISPADAARAELPRIGSDAARDDRAGRAEKAGKLMLMGPSRSENFWQYKSWDEAINHPEADAEEDKASPSGTSGKRISALAAVVAIAAITGAAGGALATGGLAHLFGSNNTQVAAAQTRSVDEAIARIDTELAALKVNIDRTGKQATSQISKTNDRVEKTSDRVEKIEKAQAEPLAKIAKLSESVEKLRATPAPVPVAAVPPPKEDPRDVTGSIAKPAVAAPKSDVARMPTVDGWVLHEVNNGGATIEGRAGVFEVYAGDPVPGLGRIDAIRRQDGRWVVVTRRGLIVSR